MPIVTIPIITNDMMVLRNPLIAFLCALFTSCSDPVQQADALAQSAHMKRELVRTDAFTLTAYTRATNPHAPVTVYIEGDGFAWQSKSEPSLNPTPRKALGLQLAAVDASANVIYLSRPCQFTPSALNPRCEAAYWTTKRFAPEVIASMQQAISQLVAPGQKIHLVGYSGGAAVAALMATSRQDVLSLRTLAGSLDSEGFNRYHHVSAMPGSLNPVRFAPELATLPQEHFIGVADDIIPASLSAGFMKAMGNTHCAIVTHVPQANHEEYWVAFWRAASLHLPACH